MTAAPTPRPSAFFRSARWARCWQAALIVLAGLGALAPALEGGWLWDDNLYITENPVLRTAGGLEKIWLHPTGVNYFPITATVQWCQWQLWHDRTLGYHLTNLALHLFSAFLVWRLLDKLGLGRGWIGGLIFALHPLGVESVAWIAEIKNTLSLPPLLLASLAWLDGEGQPDAPAPPAARTKGNGLGALAGGRGYLPSLLWFLVAMLSKSTVAVFPCLLLLYAMWRRGRITKEDVAAALPFFAVSLLLSGVTIWFEHHRAMGLPALPASHEWARIATAGISAGFYLGKSLFPCRLLSIYPKWPVDPPGLSQFLPWLVFAAVLAWLGRRRSRAAGGLAFALAWFGGNLLPVLGFIPMAYQFFSWVADHFAYISLVSVAGLGAAACDRLGASRRVAARRLGALAVAAVLAGFFWESRHLAGFYRDGIRLWRHTLEENPGAWAAHDNLGAALAKEDRLAEAVPEYEEALRLWPAYADAEYNLGVALAKMGRAPEAIRHYERALEIQPQFPKADNNLGSMLSDRRQFPEAVAHLQRALRLQPDFSEAENNLGIALVGEGRLDEGMRHYRAALRLDPDFAEAHNNLGNALDLAGRREEAIEQYRATLRIEPAFAEAYFNLGNVYSEEQQLAPAIAAYGEALCLRPDYAEFHVNLADTLAAAGRRDEAIAHLRRAVALRPSLEIAHFDLANELFNAGRPAEAVPEYEAALRLAPNRAATQNNLGSALLEAHHPAEAVAHYREALRLVPDYGDARANLARALRRLGREAEAEAVAGGRE